MHKLNTVLMLSCAVLVTACGGDATLGGGGGGLGGGGGGTTDYKVGNSLSGSFQKGKVGIGLSDVAAGGSTSLALDIVDKSGQLAFGVPVSVSFFSSCASSGTATIDPETVSTSNGRANATYTANGCSGSDTITAQVAVDGVVLTATGTLNVQPATLGGLEFVSATPAVIGLTGTSIPKQSTVIFLLKDSSGSNLPNRTVNFSLSTSVGGITLSPTSAVSGNDGTVRTTVTAGSVPTSVRVRAEATNPSNGLTIASLSEGLVISTGLPDQNSMSISADKFSVDGACDGASATINIRAADRYNNPIPAGTAFSFLTEGGKINSQCQTGDPLGDPATESSVCSVLLTVQNPRPANGRVTVLATALGEESFTDSNGNGFRDSGEAFGDLGEAFVDADENGSRSSNEIFLDLNGSSSYNSGNGQYDGYVCDSPGVNCRSDSVHVRDSIVIVFAATSADPVLTGPTSIVTPVNTTKPVSFTVKDVNGNSLPSGTTYSLSATVGSVVAPSTQGPFNTLNGDSVNYVFSAGDTAKDGTASFTINIPASPCTGVRTLTYTLSVSVTP